MGLSKAAAVTAVKAATRGCERGALLALIDKAQTEVTLLRSSLHGDEEPASIVQYLREYMQEIQGEPSSKPFVINLIHQQNKERKTRKRTFTQMPTYEQVTEAVEQVYNRFCREAFEIRIDQEVISANNWEALARSKARQKGPIDVAVVSRRKPFRSFNLKDGLDLMGIGLVTDEPDLLTVVDLVLDEALPERITELLGWKTVQDLMDHVGRDLAARAFISNPQDSAKEARCRELISPVLMAAVVLAGGGSIELHADFPVDGVHSNGSIDWVMVYKKFNIVVIEAKLFDKWEEYVGQLAAEIMGSREEFALTVLGKRKCEAAEAMSKVPSWGILTTGLAYKFYKYTELAEPDAGGEQRMALLQSTTIPLHLRRGMNADAAQKAVLPVIAVMKGILEEQKACVDAVPELKRMRPS